MHEGVIARENYWCSLALRLTLQSWNYVGLWKLHKEGDMESYDMCKGEKTLAKQHKLKSLS